MEINPDYHRRVNAVIDYIEEHINETLNDYIRRLRLEKGARLLKHRRGSVTDVAYTLGYSSSANFARDFRSYFRISPSKVGLEPLQATRTQISGQKDAVQREKLFHLEFSGIIELSVIHVLYLRTSNGYRPERIQQLFRELLNFAADQDLMTTDSRTIGIGYDDPDFTPAHRCRYDACLAIPFEKIDDFEAPFRYRSIPGGRYAKFSFFGTAEQFWPAWDRVFSNWLVGSSWIPENRPHLEYYLPLSYKKENRHRADLLLPVRPINLDKKSKI